MKQHALLSSLPLFRSQRDLGNRTAHLHWKCCWLELKCLIVYTSEQWNWVLDEYQKHVRPNQIMSFYCVVMLANGFLMAYSLTYMQNYQTNYILIISKIIRLITAMLGCVGVDIKLLFLGFQGCSKCETRLTIYHVYEFYYFEINILCAEIQYEQQ